jgi:hypothetical protein
VKQIFLKPAKIILGPSYRLIKRQITAIRIKKLEKSININATKTFDYLNFANRLRGFLQQMRSGSEPFIYRYSETSTKPTLYASSYACMTLSLIGELAKLERKDRDQWVRYFDSFQREEDGLFYDSVVENEIYADTDWWGARHLALHMISAYTGLNARPKFPFKFLNAYYDQRFMRKWLDQYDWSSVSVGDEDPDNKIMNIGCLLQYQRDAWGDQEAGTAVERLKSTLRERINSHTGMWGGFSPEDKHQHSRMVQFAYHLLPIFFYDNDFAFDVETIVEIVLLTQNKYGGYGVSLNSSACEDIDSIDLLIRFHPFCSKDLQLKINRSLERGFNWVLLNQVEDGGFVFRLYEPFVYGHIETASQSNKGAMLPTWFRTLCLAYLSNHFDVKTSFKITKCPGYEF